MGLNQIEILPTVCHSQSTLLTSIYISSLYLLVISLPFVSGQCAPGFCSHSDEWTVFTECPLKYNVMFCLFVLQKKSRKKMCCLLLIFLIVAIIIVVIVVTAVKTWDVRVFFLLKASRILSSHLEPDLGSCSVSKGTNFVCYLANILIWLVTIFSHLCVEFSEKRFKMCIDLRQCLFNLRWPCAMNRMLKIHLLPDLSHWSCAVSVDTDVTKAYICALVWLGEGGGGGGGSTMN